MAAETLPAFPRSAVNRVWYGEGRAAQMVRVAAAPLAAMYGGVVGARRVLYDAGLLSVHDTALPAVSVGNLTVGGTGKTPVAAWVVGGLLERGQRPAIVLRGYRGADEALVHRVLNPGVTVIVAADRVQGIAAAAAQGSDVAVLDDAFQHRRARRVADLVLVSADAWPRTRLLLPAGPWREPLRALRRATAIIITRKAADRKRVAAVSAVVEEAAPGIPIAVAALVSDALRTLDGASQPLTSLRGARVRAVAGVAWPTAFFAQVAGLATHVDGLAFGDHHQYTPADVAEIRRRTGPGVAVICTLKDAVKLDLLWPREAGPLWYVSQRVEFERGLESVIAALDATRRGRPASVA